MYQTKLLKDYELLSPAGKRYMVEHFRKNGYICPERQNELLKLAEFLIGQKSFSPKSTDRKRVFKYVFGREDFEAAKLDHLLSCFHELVAYARQI